MSELTVIVPVWDAYVSCLPDCLAAIRAQDVDARIVIVDNASLVPVPPQEADVTVLATAKRLTVGAARNAGLDDVSTEYVCFADVDDRVLPETWRFLLGRLRRGPEVVAAAAQLWWVDAATGDEQPAPSPRPHVYRHLNGRPRLFALYMALRMALPTTTVTIFRTATVIQAGGFGDSNVAEDWTLAAAVTLRGRVEQHARPGARVLLHHGSLFNRRLTRHEIRTGMRELRHRLQMDSCTPTWLRLLLGPIGIFHALKATLNAARPAFDRSTGGT